MKKVTPVVLVLLVLGVSDVILFPSHEWRAVRSPYTQNTFMLSGSYPPTNYVPENFMTSFGGGGEAIATNTYGEPETFDTEQEDVITEIKNPNPEPQLEQKPSIEDAVVITEQPSPSPSKRKPDDKNVAEDNGKGAAPADAEDEEEDSPWPFLKDPRRSYNAFFPIVIGGYPDARGLTRSSGEYPAGSGAATAIANSFSTGRGGVASSHATSFGDPYLSMLLRNAIFKRRNLTEKDE